MAFTRFHDDPGRIQKSLDESTYMGRYLLNTPGPGVGLPYEEDVQIRLQGWGANLGKNSTNWESDLRGLTRKLNRDIPEANEYTKYASIPQHVAYPSAQPYVEESRATHPAWMYKDQDQTRWEYPWLNPQANLEKPFDWDIQTRILTKDSISSVPRY